MEKKWLRNRRFCVITLLTDFGLSDSYIGAMKGVILGIQPDVTIVDISHVIPPQNVNEAAYTLKQTYSFFPKDTVHVVIVDPGVGSGREIIGVRTDAYYFLAPDNGVLKYIFDKYPGAEVYKITNNRFFCPNVSHTFHGRDIFAPVAAHITCGVTLSELGETYSDYQSGEIRKPIVQKNTISGEIIYIDSFGNCVTNIDQDMIGGQAIKILFGVYMLHNISTVYTDVADGEALAVIGSGGTLEISVRNGNATRKLKLKIGDAVTVTLK